MSTALKSITKMGWEGRDLGLVGDRLQGVGTGQGMQCLGGTLLTSQPRPATQTSQEAPDGRVPMCPRAAQRRQLRELPGFLGWEP